MNMNDVLKTCFNTINYTTVNETHVASFFIMRCSLVKSIKLCDRKPFIKETRHVLVNLTASLEKLLAIKTEKNKINITLQNETT